jgi:hypothetical protein
MASARVSFSRGVQDHSQAIGVPASGQERRSASNLHEREIARGKCQNLRSAFLASMAV